MNDFVVGVFSAATVAMLLLEGIKWVVRKVKKSPNYDFPVKFYVFMLAVLNMPSALVLAFLGVDGYVVPTDWTSWIKILILTALQAGAQMFEYETTLSRFKSYRALNEFNKEDAVQ
jgi:hypothetical protein